MKHRAYLFIGPPASGKGTHGKVIGQLPGFCHFSMGSAFRNRNPHGARAVELREQIRHSFATGELISDDIVLDAFRAELERLAASGAYRPEEDRLLLDGIPRTRGQAEGLAGELEVLKVFQIVCDRDVIIERVRGRALTEGRADDTMAVLEKRLEIYEKEIDALMDFYPKKLIVRIDSTRPPAKVLQAFLEHID